MSTQKEVYTLRLETTDVRRLERLAEGTPILSHALAREALRLGLAQVEREGLVALDPRLQTTLAELRWGTEPLTKFLDMVMFNLRVVAVSHRPLFQLLRDAQRLYFDLTEVEKTDAKTLIPSVFCRRAHSSLLAAAGLALASQTHDVFPSVRAALEHALYAFHAFKYPKSMDLFIRSDGTKADQLQVHAEFAWGKIRKTLEQVDRPLADRAQRLYKEAIFYGAHPNIGQLASSMREEKTAETITWKVGYLVRHPLVIAQGLIRVTDATLVTLEVFEHIWSDRFAIMDLDKRLAKLVAHRQAIVFDGQGQPTRRRR